MLRRHCRLAQTNKLDIIEVALHQPHLHVNNQLRLNNLRKRRGLGWSLKTHFIFGTSQAHILNLMQL